nr:MAG TPA: Dec protein, OB-Fold, Decoration, VIRAL PROTEIN [Caudoviricetes sp.]
MQKYIGVKRIKARPMTRGDYNTYRGWQIPADEDPADEGYLVKYRDGYESWSPKEVFEEAYVVEDVSPLLATVFDMKSSDYKKRFEAEYRQLRIRYEGLKRMCEKWDAGELDFTPTCPRAIYDKQLSAMVDYLSVLEVRAYDEGIDLRG